MNRYRWPSFSQLISDLFADVRQLMAMLRRREGQMAFMLIAVTLATAIGLFFVVLGFDRLSDVSTARGWRPFQCRTPDNFQSLFIVIGGVLFTLLAVLTLGETMLYLDRKRRGRPGNLSHVATPAAVMMVIGGAGAVGMRFWC